MDLTGIEINKCYIIRKIIEENSFSTLWNARALFSAKELIIRFLTKKDSNYDVGELVNFKKDIMSFYKISHPNVIGMIEMDSYKGYTFIVTEFVNGKNLKQYCKSVETIKFEYILNIIIQIAIGLEVIHSNNLVHKNINPESIWLSIDNDGVIDVVKITNFVFIDLKNYFDNINNSGKIKNLEYMAPEVRNRELTMIDKRADQFSLGLIFYELIVGSLPFNKKNTYEYTDFSINEIVIKKLLKEKNATDNTINLILKLLKIDPNERYNSDIEVLNELKKIISENKFYIKAISEQKEYFGIKNHLIKNNFKIHSYINSDFNNVTDLEYINYWDKIASKIENTDSSKGYYDSISNEKNVPNNKSQNNFIEQFNNPIEKENISPPKEYFDSISNETNVPNNKSQNVFKEQFNNLIEKENISPSKGYFDSISNETNVPNNKSQNNFIEQFNNPIEKENISPSKGYYDSISNEKNVPNNKSQNVFKEQFNPIEKENISPSKGYYDSISNEKNVPNNKSQNVFKEQFNNPIEKENISPSKGYYDSISNEKNVPNNKSQNVFKEQFNNPIEKENISPPKGYFDSISNETNVPNNKSQNVFKEQFNNPIEKENISPSKGYFDSISNETNVPKNKSQNVFKEQFNNPIETSEEVNNENILDYKPNELKIELIPTTPFDVQENIDNKEYFEKKKPDNIIVDGEKKYNKKIKRKDKESVFNRVLEYFKKNNEKKYVSEKPLFDYSKKTNSFEISNKNKEYFEKIILPVKSQQSESQLVNEKQVDNIIDENNEINKNIDYYMNKYFKDLYEKDNKELFIPNDDLEMLEAVEPEKHRKVNLPINFKSKKLLRDRDLKKHLKAKSINKNQMISFIKNQTIGLHENIGKSLMIGENKEKDKYEMIVELKEYFKENNFRVIQYKCNKKNETSDFGIFFDLINKISFKDIVITNIKTKLNSNNKNYLLFLNAFEKFDEFKNKVLSMNKIDGLKILVELFFYFGSSDNPFILFIFNLQNSDEQSIKTILEISKGIKNAPILLVGFYDKSSVDSNSNISKILKISIDKN